MKKMKFLQSMRNGNRIDRIKKQVPELEKKLEVLRDAYDKKWNNAPQGMDHIEFRKHFEPETTQIQEINNKLRFVQDYTLDEIPEYGDVMSLEDFKGNVECGGFIDSDGFGNYARDGKMSNITIYPSDYKRGFVRSDFDSVVWFNK